MKRLVGFAVAALLVGVSGCALLTPSSEVLYEETFSGPTASAWLSGSTATSDNWIDNGRYYILVKSDVSTVRFNQLEGPFADVQIDLDVTHVLGTPNLSGAGLIFRVTDVNNMYAFFVSAFGSFSVAKWVNGTPTTLLAWAESPAVNKGAATNHLTVIAHGSSLTFLVNKTEVAMLTDTSLSSGSVGLIAKAFDADVDVIEAYDNLIVQTAGD
jgi:hypothetical protein